MKTTKIKSISVCFLLLFISACGQNKTPKKNSPIAKKSALTSGIFTGKYIASYENASISAELTENDNIVKGFFYMDGVQNELKAISDRNTMTGKLKDKSKSVYYNFTANLKNNILHFSITFPELNNQVVELLLTKQGYTSGGENNLTITNGDSNITTSETTNSSSSKPSTQLNSRAKDRRLIGTWRYTEVLSSGGYGGDYASAATDYFIQFKPNGECLSWSGSSAGGTSDVTYESRGNGNVTTEGWYTEGKNVVFYDLNTNEEVSIPFLADENRFLLKGGSTKIYERVN
ncbi:hypothetical protein [Flavobacterium sp.]|jgi:hypothetical protein|uniref:hypothetical protein n=1 Tax=Flavobacterium sp. TaxID=239 RepID=UPI0022C62D4E|nr:hypothetical protein [Flavobacterium sp.]MCZ8091614.1 hypothetical protein [Flavobacterium sp.]